MANNCNADREICDLYQSGLSIMDVCRRTGASRGLVANVLRRNGVSLRKRGGGHSTKPVSIDPIVVKECYERGLSISQVAAKLNIGVSTVIRRLNSMGVTTRSPSESRRQHSLNEHFFDFIDSESKAYWLGFILADGCVRTGKNTLTINLSAQDSGHLESFRKSLESSHPISNPDKYGTFGIVSFTVTSSHLTDRLRELGIVANNKKCFPPEGFEKHYWRGVIDGDGSIGVSFAKRKTKEPCPQPWITVIGTDCTVIKFCELARQVCGARINPQNLNKNAKSSIVHGPKALLLTRHLYQNSSVFLPRKMSKYLEMENLVGGRV